MVWRLLKLLKPQIETNLFKVAIKNGTTMMLMAKRSLVSNHTRTSTTLTIRDNKSEEDFQSRVINSLLYNKDTGAVLRNAFYHDKSIRVVTVLSLKTSTTLEMMVPSRQVGLKLMATVTTVATILMMTPLKETSTQELSTLNSLAQMENS